MAEKSRYNYRVEPQDVDFTLRATIPSLGGAILNTAGEGGHGNGVGGGAVEAANHPRGRARRAAGGGYQPRPHPEHEVAAGVRDDGGGMSGEVEDWIRRRGGAKRGDYLGV